MVVPELLEEVLITLAIGSLMGIERERLKGKHLGLRTSALLAMAGPVSVKISTILSSVVPVLIYIGLGGAISILIVKIRMDTEEEDIGLTTSTCVFVLVLVSLLVGYSHYFEAVSISIIATFLLAEKKNIRSKVSGLTDDEIIDALKVGAAAFILYPLLPSEPVTSLGLLNPQKVLLFILLVLGIRFTAFVASKQLSQSRGLPVTGLLGGAVSSLATVSAFSEMSKKQKEIGIISVGMLLSTAAMVVRNIVIVSFSSLEMLKALAIPGVSIVAVGLILSFFSWERSSLHGGKVKEVLRSPLSFKPAIKLGIYFLIITVVGNALKNIVGQQGLWMVAFFGGLVSSAAVAVSALSMISSQVVTPQIGSMMVILACVSSILVKIFVIGTGGSLKITKRMVPILLIMAAAGILPLLLL